MEGVMRSIQDLVGSGQLALPAVFFVAAIGSVAAIYEFFAGSRRAVVPPAVRAHVFEHLKNARRREALSQAQDTNSPFTNIAKAALRLPADTPSYVAYASIEDGLFREISAMRSRVALIQGLGLLCLLAGLAGALGGLYKNLAAGSIQTPATIAKAVTDALPAATAGVLCAIVIFALAFLFQMRLSSNEAALTGDSSRLAAYLLGPKYVEAVLPDGPMIAPAVDDTHGFIVVKPEDKGENVAPSQPA